ncbi:permease-like cell division protein FtsX [Serpentinicella sp. ANB-PHB4]|uniref:permease-like cell division protein FtsX n=1 Tax=Serpentinicella sp. ANB-PHB4 TaxID=3074076 RepID=UPI002866B04F|nr:permease-like cell division protein FtsX [Serpentinicella sp. ANB-PHB4]MDR5658849.1 permease-like cell division protein FtsX [Serpentinicella sp. ANB-PHB4]
MNRHAFRYCMRQSMQSLSRNAWLAVITSGLIAISLIILGGFFLVTTNVNQFIRNVESNIEVSVFLNEGVNETEIQQRIEQLEGVVSQSFVPKEEGLYDFGRNMGDPALLRDLEGENNPLPDLIRVRVEDPEKVVAVAETINTYPEVELVDYGEELVARLMQITGRLNFLFLVLGVAIALGAIFLIVNIIRLSAVARQEEVVVMKYMGASDGYIRFPFLMEGMVMGWIGTVVAILTLGFIYFRLTSSFSQDSLILLFQPVTDIGRLLPIFIGLMLGGTLMSAFGSFVSIRKYLKV